MFALRKLSDEARRYEVDEEGRKLLEGSCYGDNERYDNRDYNCEHDGDDDEDLTWVPDEGSEDDLEPLECTSDVESLESEDTVMEDAGEDTPSDREALRQFWVQALLARPVSYEEERREAREDFPAWYRNAPVITCPHLDPSIKDEMFPLYLPSLEPGALGEREQSPGKSESLGYRFLDQKAQYGNHVEHIAGPRCRLKHGYSGHEISTLEMRNCQVAQALVRKPKMLKFEPLPDDEDFERTGDFFLSGLTER